MRSPSPWQALLAPALVLLWGCGGGGGGPGTPTGTLVDDFGMGGWVESNASPGPDVARAVVASATHLYVGGLDDQVGNADYQWRIEKRSLTDGSLDPAFGTGGVIQVNHGPGSDQVNAMAIDAQAIYVGGWDSGPGNLQWRVEKRSLLDGSLIGAFGSGGVVTVNPTPGGDSLTALLVVGTALYLAGNDGNSIVIEKRSAIDGDLDAGFGTGGVIYSNPSPSYDTASALATDGGALFVAGRDQSLGVGDWSLRVEKRELGTGALVPGFGMGGVVTSSPSPTYDAAYAIAYEGGWLYLAGTDEGPGAANRAFHIEKRSAASGLPDPGFGAGGSISDDYGAGDDELSCIVVGGGALYVGGSDEAPGHGRWHIQKRHTSDGSLVASFGSGGKVIEDLSPYYEGVHGLVLDVRALFAVGFANDPTMNDVFLRIEKRLR